MFFVFPSAVYPRRKEESIFKFLYQLCGIAHFISFVVLMTEFVVRQQSTLPGYFTSSEVYIGKGLEVVTRDCKYSGSLDIGGIKSPVYVNSVSLQVPMALMAKYVIGVLVVEFLAILTHGVSLMNYSAGGRHLRIFGVHVPLYHILTTFSFIYCIVLILLVWITYNWRMFFKRAIMYCADQMLSTDKALVWEAEFDEYNTFSTPVEWAFGAAVINLFVYISGACVLTWKSYDAEIRLLSEATVPWEERGVLCRTNKPALRIHTTARDAILKEAHSAILRGEKVRIVCNYVLMTEADYEAQVEEMRQRFADQIREQQFEHLETHFGRESDLEEDGLLWRQHPLPPPPPLDDMDEFVVTENYANAHDKVKISDGIDEFDEIADERNEGDDFWSELDGDSYDVADADERGELAEDMGASRRKHRRPHKERRRRRRRFHAGEGEGALEQRQQRQQHEEEGEGDLSIPASLPPAYYYMNELAYGGGDENVADADEYSLRENDSQHHYNHHSRRRRHHHRPRTQSEGNGEFNGRLDEVGSPIEDADEL